MKLIVMWVSGIGVILGIIYLTGCSQSRWYPTDPRVETPAENSIVVDETWRVDVGTTLTASTP